mmetsp:Transcript_8697/g.17697  ORF Transcript_8697/g.17697 Transcript_8697/m.17697 type:complete len:559 (+) Transcript_8697:91-1767(+)
MSKDQNVIDLGERSVAIIGGGLVGCLLGVYLRQHKYTVDIFESRADPRTAVEKGRSINLVITSRGLHALTSLSPELASKVMKVTTRVEGRTLHNAQGETTYQSYGPTASFCNFSVSRWELNKVLMDAAQDAGCRLHFSSPLTHIDIPAKTCTFDAAAPPPPVEGVPLAPKTVYRARLVFGADGGGSRCRQALIGGLPQREEEKAPSPQRNNESIPLGYGYKELFMPAVASTASPKEGDADSTGYAVHKDSLHIWPRGSHFMMGLANLDGSFTMTLYAHDKGKPESFENLSTREAVAAFFQQHYPSALALMPTAVDDFLERPVGHLGTLFCAPWVAPPIEGADSSGGGGGFALIGDSAHAFTPFFGQGCNCGFEDVSVLHDILSKYETAAAEAAVLLPPAAAAAESTDDASAAGAGIVVDMAAVLAEYYELRKPCADAIALMALENFDEMMSKTADPRFLLEKDIENALALRFPAVYVSRYALITHSLLPYSQCKAVGSVQSAILRQLSEGLESVAGLDQDLAEQLVTTTLKPFIDSHVGAAAWAEQCHYTSPYYDNTF